MKALILGLLICSSAQAITLGHLYSSPEGSSVQQFILNDSKMIYKKKSNFFDKKQDYRLGVFETPINKASKEDKKKLEKLLVKIKGIDDFMQKKNESFNSLSYIKPHASFFTLEDYRISQESDLYPEVNAIYERLYGAGWKHKSGIKLSNDTKKLIHINNGKESSDEAFNFSFHCQKAGPPSICGFKDEGILYVK